MIITCPNCHTRYQLAEKAISSAGRKVSCAQCQESWHAKPDPEPPIERPKPKLVAQKPPQDKDKMFDAKEEAALDAQFERADDKKPKVVDAAQSVPETPTDEPTKDKRRKSDVVETQAGAEVSDNLDVGLKGKRRKAMRDRQAALRKKLPMGRIRQNVRFAVLILLAGLIAGGVYFRTDIVRFAPDMAGVYARIGLPVNVIGLEFENVETLRTMQNGVDVMLVTGQVRNIKGSQVKVPAIVVSILNSDGASLYSWSVTPVSPVLGPHKKLDFEARLNSAPENAANVKLAFAEDRTK